MEYRVILFKDNIYHVYNGYKEVLFEGNLSDCNAWINLTEKGYL